jgi:hypothetical protein
MARTHVTLVGLLAAVACAGTAHAQAPQKLFVEGDIVRPLGMDSGQ